MIRELAFIDASDFTATLIRAHKKAMEPTEYGSRLILRDGDNMPLLKDWNSARGLLAKIRNAVAPFNGGVPAVIKRAAVQSLKVGGVLPWEIEEDDGFQRVHLGLVPSPGAYLYSGSQMICPAVGALYYVAHRLLHSAINLGPCSQMSLICEIVKDDAPE